MALDEHIEALQAWLSGILEESVQFKHNGTRTFYCDNIVVHSPHMSCRVMGAERYHKLATIVGAHIERMPGDRSRLYWQQKISCWNWSIEPDGSTEKAGTTACEFMKKYGAQHGLVGSHPINPGERIVAVLSKLYAKVLGN